MSEVISKCPFSAERSDVTPFEKLTELVRRVTYQQTEELFPPTSFRELLDNSHGRIVPDKPPLFKPGDIYKLRDSDAGIEVSQNHHVRRRLNLQQDRIFSVAVSGWNAIVNGTAIDKNREVIPSLSQRIYQSFTESKGERLFSRSVAESFLETVVDFKNAFPTLMPILYSMMGSSENPPVTVHRDIQHWLLISLKAKEQAVNHKRFARVRKLISGETSEVRCAGKIVGLNFIEAQFDAADLINQHKNTLERYRLQFSPEELMRRERAEIVGFNKKLSTLVNSLNQEARRECDVEIT